MLALAFHVGRHRFALRCSEVIEVVPRVALREIPHAPPWVPGSFLYRGSVAPVVDLGVLLWGVPCADRLSTRLIVVRGRADGSTQRLAGLLGERVTEAVELTDETATSPAVAVAAAPYLGEAYSDGPGMIQRILVEELLDGTLAGAAGRGTA